MELIVAIIEPIDARVERIAYALGCLWYIYPLEPIITGMDHWC